MTSYRPDIDGLRAAAILSVLFFHLDISLIKGGYLGVDVFFVISGFLIAGIIRDEIERGEFSLAGFYERRARRILPALLAVCLACLAGFFFVFLPRDYIELNQSVAAALLFVSNIFFWRKTGYFATDTDEKPLLHTWSLGIEEQFYILLPLLLVFLSRRQAQQSIPVVVAGLAAFSLLAAEMAVRQGNNAAFYLLPFRFWELAVGALLALIRPPPLSVPHADNLLTVAGLLLILFSVLSFSSSSGVPGLAAVFPCLGAVLVLYAGGRATISHRTLTLEPIVWIGKISYSLYLWHWPVLAFANYMTKTPYEGAGRLWILLASFALAGLSWKYIETPFRDRKFLSRQKIFALAGGATGILVLVALGGAMMKGYPSRFSPEILALEAVTGKDQPDFVHETCLPEEGKPFSAVAAECQLGDLSRPEVTAILWGDSHASAFGPVVDALLKEHRIRAVMETKSACPGFVGTYRWDTKDFPSCLDFNKKVLDAIHRDGRIRTIFFAGRLTPVAEKFIGEVEFSKALSSTQKILEAQGIRVFFIGPVPEPEFDVPRCLLRQAQFGKTLMPCTPPDVEKIREAHADVLKALERIEPQTRVFYPQRSLCSATRCLITVNGKAAYFDDDHLSRTGAMFLLNDLERTFGPDLEIR